MIFQNVPADCLSYTYPSKTRERGVRSLISKTLRGMETILFTPSSYLYVYNVKTKSWLAYTQIGEKQPSRQIDGPGGASENDDFTLF